MLGSPRRLRMALAAWGAVALLLLAPMMCSGVTKHRMGAFYFQDGATSKYLQQSSWRPSELVNTRSLGLQVPPTSPPWVCTLMTDTLSATSSFSDRFFLGLVVASKILHSVVSNAQSQPAGQEWSISTSTRSSWTCVCRLWRAWISPSAFNQNLFHSTCICTSD